MPDEVEKRIKKAADWKVCRENCRLPMFTRLPVSNTSIKKLVQIYAGVQPVKTEIYRNGKWSG